jgi:ubiquitin-protein ligase
MSEELLDEITSINSIYGENTLVATSDDSTIYALTLPTSPKISLRTEFPANYPDAPPSILGTQHIGDNVAKGEGQQIVDCIRTVLADIYIPGLPCIFDLIE